MRLIDADVLKENLGDTRDGEPVFRDTEFIRMDVLEEAIDKAPTIKTFTLADIEEQYRNGLEKGLEERPHGEWMKRRIKYFVSEYERCHYYSVCSICNAVHLDTDLPNFCPYCGAKMKGGEENEQT